MTRRRTISPVATRDAALLALGIGVVSLFVTGAGTVAMSAAVATVLVGGSWRAPAVTEWFTIAGQLFVHPGQAETLPGPWGPALAGHAVTLWTVTLLLTGLVVAALVGIGVPVWRAFGPMPPGHANREDIRRELSPAAVRRTARWTRPSLSVRERRHVPLEQVGVPQHCGPHGSPLWTPLENPTGVIAPTQSGKSRQDHVHKVLAAPGALLCSTTKPDLLEFAGLSRSRCRHAGPVLVFDATGSVPWPAQLRWSPIDGCTTPDVARRRAEAMVEAASINLSNVSGNDKVFRDRAKSVLQTYLLAAAHCTLGVEALVRWAVNREDEPVRLLLEIYPEFARNLRKELAMVAETSDAVWMSVRRVLEPLMDPALRQLCTPSAGPFDVQAFLRAHGSVFLVAGEHQAAQAAPILTAFAEHWITTAQQLALEQPHRRLDPPASAVLDEVTHATPVPRLPEFIADSTGRGVLIHWAAQSVAKLEDTFGATGARQLLDNTTCLSIFGGLKDKASLEWISTLAGHEDRIRFQQHSDGMVGVGRTSVGTETAPVYRAGEVRTIRRGRVLVFHRNLRPIEARLIDVRKRRDWTTLRVDVESVRSGEVPIRADGYRTDIDTQREATGGR